MFTTCRHTIRCLCVYNIVAPWLWLQWWAETCRSVETSFVQLLEIKLVCLLAIHHLRETVVLWISFYTFNVSNLSILYSWWWTHSWPKHVGVYCVYNIILLYMCAFLGAITVCVYIYIYDIPVLVRGFRMEKSGARISSPLVESPDHRFTVSV